MDLLSALRSHQETLSLQDYIEKFIESEIGCMFSASRFTFPAEAKLGDYGYISKSATGNRFVVLGNVEDLVGDPVTFNVDYIGYDANGGPSPPWKPVKRLEELIGWVWHACCNREHGIWKTDL